MATSNWLLKYFVAFFVFCPSECFHIHPFLPRSSSASPELRLSKSSYCSPRDPIRTANRVRYAPPLRSNMKGDSEDDSNTFDRSERDMPLAFYRSDNGTRNSEFWEEGAEKQIDNEFFQIISTLTPGDMVGQFIKTASPRVQTAVKKTIMNLLGTLRSSPAFDSNVVTTQRALASMMFQMEMTGYMFRNAEYRLAIQQSLSRALPLAGGDAPAAAAPRLEGQITVKLPGGEVKVDAETYVSELSSEVQRLRNELVSLKQEHAEEKGKDLVAYIQAMEPGDLQSLTAGISPEVLQAMQLLVDSVMVGISGGPMVAGLVGPDAVTELNSGALAQLCMWQLVIGYNLREMEARKDLDNRLPAE